MPEAGIEPARPLLTKRRILSPHYNRNKSNVYLRFLFRNYTAVAAWKPNIGADLIFFAEQISAILSIRTKTDSDSHPNTVTDME